MERILQFMPIPNGVQGKGPNLEEQPRRAWFYFWGEKRKPGAQNTKQNQQQTAFI